MGGSLTMVGAVIKGSLVADGAVLESLFSLDSAKVGQHLHLENTVMRGKVMFASARVAGLFNASNAKLLARGDAGAMPATVPATASSTTRSTTRSMTDATNPTRVVATTPAATNATSRPSMGPTSRPSDEPDNEFFAMTVGGDCYFDSIRVDGTAGFRSFSAGRDLNLDSARLASAFNFFDGSVGGNLTLRNAVFRSPFTMVRVRVNGSMDVEGTQFLDAMSVNASRVGESLNLGDALFGGPVDFSWAKVAGPLYGRHVQFLAPAAPSTTRLAEGDDPPPQSHSFYALQVGGSFELTDARFDGNVNFEGLDVGDVVNLSGSRFLAPVAFGQIHARKNVFLNQVEFHDVDFNSARVDGSLIVTDGKFVGPADFTDAKVAGQFRAERARFGYRDETAGPPTRASAATAPSTRPSTMPSTQPSGRAPTSQPSTRRFVPDFDNNFYSMSVGGQCNFAEAVFEGATTFELLRIGDDLSLFHARFDGKSDFTASVVGGFAVIEGALFEGPAVFARSHVAGFLNGQQAAFRDRASFNDARVDRSVFLDRAEFSGPADFTSFKVGGQLQASKAKFRLSPPGTGGPAADRDSPAEFYSMGVSGQLFMNDAVFERRADFQLLKVASEVGMTGTHFERGVDFSGAAVEGDWSFRGARFGAGSSFAAAKAGGQFDASGASFLRRSPIDRVDVNLGGMTVGRDATFDAATFESGADFQGATVGGNLGFSGARFHDRESEVNLDEVAVGNKAVFDGTTFGGTVRIALSYHEISAVAAQGRSESERFDDLLAFVQKAQYNPVAFLRLEEYLKRKGYSEWGDTVFISQQQADRRMRLGARDGKWWSGPILYHLIRYGRRPARAFVWSGVVVLFGTIVFRGSKMKSSIAGDVGYDWSSASGLQKPTETKRGYSSFWYSLDFFLPVIGLKSEDAWTPRPQCTVLILYTRFHKLLGWILIPLGVAAISGLVH